MRIRAPLTLVCLGAVAMAPPAALAQQAPTTTTPAPAAAPVAGSLSLIPQEIGGGGAVLVGRHFRVRGVVKPYVAGQTATVRFYRGKSKILVRTVSLLPSGTGRSGYFLVGRTPHEPGRITIKASHLGTAQLGTVVARPVSIDVLPLRAAVGSTGQVVRLLQRRLRALHYVVGRLGVFDARTARAVEAFRKLNDMQRTQVADSAVFRRLAHGGGAFKVRYPEHDRHVEADLTHQVLALIAVGGHVERIYPLSSGKASTPTVLGTFSVYSKTPGTNAKGMFFSNYFIRGFAIHGYYDVPPYAASHGCLRVPIPDAIPIYNWIHYGTTVDVYYR